MQRGLLDRPIDLFAEEVGSEALATEALPDMAAASSTVGTASCVACITGTAGTTFCAFSYAA